MMDPKDMSARQTETETRIRSLQSLRQRLMFSELADAFPDCTWQVLFNALARLHKLGHIELVAHRWDYEVIFLGTPTSHHEISRSTRTPERCEHGERAQT